MTSFLPVWCYQRDASCNIALVVFADGRCGVYHNDPNVKIKTVQHSPDWSLLYLLAEADPLFNSDWLHRGEPRSLSPEYLRHESLSFGFPPAGPPFTDAKTTEINLTTSLVTQKTRAKAASWGGIIDSLGWNRAEVPEGFTPAAEYQEYSAYMSISWPCEPWTTEWRGNRTPDLWGESDWTTRTTSARGFTSVWNTPQRDGCKICQKHFWLKPESKAAYRHSSKHFHVLTDFPEGGLGMHYFRDF